VGAYRLLVNGVHASRFAFVVDAPPGESDLASRELPDVASQPYEEGVAGAGVEQPLTPWLLAVIVMLLFAEVWLRQVRRR
jgi:hypothetical protein